MEESACGLEWRIRTACSPAPEYEDVVLSYGEARHYVGWWDKPRIRIPCFLAGWLERSNCVFTEYVDCKVVEGGEPVA